MKEKHTNVKAISDGGSLGYQCLFCASPFGGSSKGLEKNVNHMLIKHGLFIPDRTMLWDIRSFLGYLATQVQVWHECLYCGITKATARSIQDHMRDSGHCMLNFEKEPELAEFWECRSKTTKRCVEPVSHHAATGTRKPKHSPVKTVMSSKVCSPVGSKLQERRMRQSSPVKQKLTISSCTPQHGKTRHIRCRDEVGVLNISLEKRNALVVAIKRSQRDQAIVGRAKEWSYARKANDQKHDQAHGALSWAKGGMHNLLPR